MLQGDSTTTRGFPTLVDGNIPNRLASGEVSINGLSLKFGGQLANPKYIVRSGGWE
jgi:hypothetical protein